MHQIINLSKLRHWSTKALYLKSWPTKALSLKRYIPATVALLAGVSLSVVAGLMMRHWERERMEIQFQRQGDNLATTLQKSIDSDLEVLQSLSSFFAASQSVSRQEFKTFVAMALARHDSILALQWQERVFDADRQTYVKDLRSQGYPAFEITQKNSQGKQVVAKQRPEYFPIVYIEPFDPNKKAFGYDPSADARRNAVLEKARDTKTTAITGPIELVQETERQYSFVAHLPIYRNGTDTHTLEARRKELTGFVAGVFRAPNIVKEALAGLKVEDIDFYLYDRSAPVGESFLAFYDAKTKQVVGDPASQQLMRYKGFFCDRERTNCTRSLLVGDRSWSLLLRPTPEYIAAQQNWLAKITLPIGLLSTGILVTYLLQSSQRTARIEQLVRERTADLEEALQTLQEAQSQLIQTEKMSSLGQLVAGVAHEINNPVNFIYGNLAHAKEYTENLLDLLQLYQKELPNPTPAIENKIEAVDLEFLSEDLPKLLGSMKVGVERIREIVRSLRNFSRVDEAEMKEVDIHEGIDSTLMILQYRLKATTEIPGITLIKEYGNIPKVECYASQLNQVFMNILANAIDALEEVNSSSAINHCSQNFYSPIPTIRIRTEVLEENRVAIRISDNGPGMPDVIHRKLFEPFFTTKPIGKGTGIGLSISHRIIVEKHGGKLTCQSDVGQGTEFLIEIPIRPKLLMTKSTVPDLVAV